MEDPTTTGANGKEDTAVEEVFISALSTPALEQKLQGLRDQSNKHSQALTQRLATSQTGQNLLHIGSSLSSLPPDLHALLQHLHPILSAAETTEKDHMKWLQQWVKLGNDIRWEQQRVGHAVECAEYWQDFVAAEAHVQKTLKSKANVVLSSMRAAQSEVNRSDPMAIQSSTDDLVFDELDIVASLERAAHTALCLLQELRTSSEHVSTLTRHGSSHLSSASDQTQHNLPSLRSPLLEKDSERAQFMMKLAPRIRRLEADVSACLTERLESLLRRLQAKKEVADQGDDSEDMLDSDDLEEDLLLLMIGHCLRGLALLGKGTDAENVFARVAIMPLIRAKVSMGRLDEGGGRGECTGLFSLLSDMATSIAATFGSVLRMAESTFAAPEGLESNEEKSFSTERMEVDLVTAGVWVPIATALMADPAIKMAIFSPGIARILQANYTSVHKFLSGLATRLLKNDKSVSFPKMEELRVILRANAKSIHRAQRRIYQHPKTAEFSKRWNLPIYYQLRFGDICSRLNKAIDRAREEGWESPSPYTGETPLESRRQDTGLELSLFVELYDILLELWDPTVFLQPLSHRFLRGSIQLISRTVHFVKDGLDGNITFGVEKKSEPHQNGESVTATNGNTDDVGLSGHLDLPSRSSRMTREPYRWCESVEDVAAIAWELTILESKLTHEYVDQACDAIAENSSSAEKDEIMKLVREVLSDASAQITPVIQHSWKGVIVSILTKRCCGPLAAVKGVAATYRMTNRPPPTKASPFVGTILRALREFDGEFKHRTPPSVGLQWKVAVVTTVALRYSTAVQELIATVQRTEVALKNRKARRTAIGGMSDGEKVKLQLFLDYKAFSDQVQETGVDPSTIEGVEKLKTLTVEGEKFKTANGGGGRRLQKPKP